MYGFPTQTEQETVDSMELVRQLFAAGVLSSAFWHRFVLTRHSGMYPRAAEYGAVVLPEPPSRFASNDVPHADPLGADHDRFDEVLPRALAAWMRGRDLDRPVTAWFDRPVPAPTEPPDRILRALAAPPPPMGDRLVWIGGDMLEDDGAIVLHSLAGPVRVAGRRAERDWLHAVVEAARPGQPPVARDAALGAFPGDWERFATRWDRVRAAGLLGIS
jgi:hypothetical protein